MVRMRKSIYGRTDGWDHPRRGSMAERRAIGGPTNRPSCKRFGELGSEEFLSAAQPALRPPWASSDMISAHDLKTDIKESVGAGRAPVHMCRCPGAVPAPHIQHPFHGMPPAPGGS